MPLVRPQIPLWLQILTRWWPQHKAGLTLMKSRSGDKGRIQASGTAWIQQLSVINEQKIILKLYTSPPRQTEVNKQQLKVNFGGLNANDIPAAQGSSSSKVLFGWGPWGCTLLCVTAREDLSPFFPVLGHLTQPMLHEHPCLLSNSILVWVGWQCFTEVDLDEGYGYN